MSRQKNYRQSLQSISISYSTIYCRWLSHESKGRWLDRVILSYSSDLGSEFRRLNPISNTKKIEDILSQYSEYAIREHDM